MSFLTEQIYGIYPDREDEIEKKYQKIPDCQYNSGVSCELKGRKCRICGFNPIVSEMRIQAIKMGDKHFLRATDRFSDDFAITKKK